VKLNSAIVSHVMTELDVTCFPSALPEFIEVDLSNMEVGQSLHLSDIKLPIGVTPVLHGQENPTIATASIPAGAVSAEEAAAAEATPPAEKK
jgi:large subunit ribosomal protein L25